MADVWHIRSADDEAPSFVPTAEYFTLQMFCGVSDIDNWRSYRFVGYVDYCSADYISKLEIVAMAKGLKLDVEGATFWFKDILSQGIGLSEIKHDLDALSMAMSVDGSRVAKLYVKLARNIACSSDAVEQKDDKDEEEGEGSELNDSEYSLHSDREDLPIVTTDGDNGVPIPEINAQDAIGREESDDEDDFHSEYAASDELESCSSTDEDELDPIKPRYAEFIEQIDMKDPQFKIGMKFGSFKQFKEAVKNYGIKNRCVMNFKPNNKKRCKAFCKKGCPFYLWASPMYKDKNTIQIKSGNLKHECTRDHNIRHVNAQWIAQHYLEQFRSDPSWNLAGIVQAVRTNQEVDISRLKAWRAKNIAARMLDGDEHTQMTRLYDYRLELLRTHPGSTIKFKCNEGIFQSMYVCLSPLRAGFLAGCRPIISVDGCFLKGHYGGQLLSAVGIDANDCIYPIAWAVVDRENYQNWIWFLELLAEDLEIYNSHGWAFMSDRQKGLQNAIQELFPNSEHRYCVRHIHTNFKKKFRGKGLKDQLWVCARASYLPAYNLAMDVLKDMSLEAHNFMKNISPCHWSRSHFKTEIKCDMLLNNLCECFNSQILQARTKGIITMNEMIRTQLMIRIQKRRDAMQRCVTDHCPKIIRKLERSKQLSWGCKTTWSGGDKYQVVGNDGQFIVDNKERSCTCRRWQLTGVPCCHAISALYYNKNKPEEFLDDCYRKSTFLATYNHILNPTQDNNCWPKSDQPPMIPPEPVNKNRGRKPLLRRKEVDEEPTGFTKGKVCRKGINIHCGICGKIGHNRRYHGVQGNNPGSSGRNSTQHQSFADASVGVNNDTNPMSTIDPQVLEEHFLEAEQLRTNEINNPAACGNVAMNETMSQALDIPVGTKPNSSFAHESHVPIENLSTEIMRQVAHGHTLPSQSTTLPSPKTGPDSQTLLASSAAVVIGFGRKKMSTRRGGGNQLLSKSQARKQLPARPPVLRHKDLEQDIEDRSKANGVQVKRKAWLPPGP